MRKPTVQSWVSQASALLFLLLCVGLILTTSPDQANRLGLLSWGLLTIGLGALFVMPTTLDRFARSIVVALASTGTACMLISYLVSGETRIITLRIAALVLIALTVPLSFLAQIARTLRRPNR